MSKKNYNKISTEKAVKMEPAVEVEETVVEEAVEVVEPKFKTGVVVGCTKLNVRKDPNANAPILITLAAGETVVVNDEVGDFYKIGNPEYPEYCMKKYISINS